MKVHPINLLLADDDPDDCLFFKEALEELPLTSSLKIVNDGEQLMHMLNSKQGTLPDILFLDLNMPRKTGLECLSEIKTNEKLKSLPIIIYSTSLDPDVVNLAFEKGAHHYIRKPGEFSDIKKVILEALAIIREENPVEPSKEKFIIQA